MKNSKNRAIISAVFGLQIYMKFDIITIFPDIFNSYLNESILGRAQKDKLIEINTHDLREYTNDKHKSVDDTPYGGGVGMLMMVEPIYKALKDIKKSDNARTILLSPRGKRFTQNKAQELTKYNQLVFVSNKPI